MAKNLLLQKANIEDIISLSPLQQGILYHYLNNPDSQQYKEQLCLTFVGYIDTDEILEAWNHVVRNNEMLRTIFKWDKLDNPIQIILKNYKIPTEIHDITSHIELEKDAFIKEITDKNYKEHIDITSYPLKLSIIKRNSNIHTLILTYHHILYDGWSNGLLIKELITACNALVQGNSPIEVEKNKFKDFIKWCQKQDKSKQQAYWSKYFVDYEAVANLPASCVSEVENVHKNVKFVFEQDFTKSIHEFCKKHKITMATILYSAWGILLQKYKNSDDIVFGTTVSGRNAKISGIEDMVGAFINTLPIRVHTDENDTVENILKKIDIMLKEREEYEQTPLVDITKYSNISWNEDLFDTLLVIENYPIDKILHDKDSSIKIEDYSMKESTNYRLTLMIIDLERLELEFSYDVDSYDDSMINNLAEHYKNVLNEITKDINTIVKDIQILTEAEKQKVLIEFNSTNADYPKNKTIHQLFEEQVDKTPNNIAVIYGAEKLTYKELNEKANQLARVFRNYGVRENTVVGIIAERSFDMIIGILGILKAGGAYLPIDPELPQDRIKYILEDSTAKIVFTQSHLLNSIPIEIQLTVVSEKNISDSVLEESDKNNLQPISKADDLAYIIYTSGSTGNPKGVMINNYNVVNILTALNKEYPITEEGAYLFKTTYTFDVSVTELFGWFVGTSGRLVILEKSGEKDPKAILKAIRSNKVTHINFVPTMLNVFINELENEGNSSLADLEYVFSAGEAISKELVNKFYNIVKGVKLHNIYGPTEITIYATNYSLDNPRSISEIKAIPIGKPMQNTRAYILDRRNILCPIGVIGELCISGAGVGRGYLNKPELTAEKFAACPFEENSIMYRTGDLARWLPDGNIEYLGRMDSQVKIRGYRIEIEEIECKLLEHEEVKEAVVAVKTDSKADKYLCAYFVSEIELNANALRKYLSKILPDYMIPSYFMQLDKLPLTSSGKLNRKALPDADNSKLKTAEYEAPRNKVEEKLVELWADILDIDNIGINDNFFELGGHSLKATTLASKIHKHLNVEIPIKQVFKYPTIKQIAQYLKEQEESIFSEIQAVEKANYYEAVAYYDASSAQKRIYTLQQFDINSTSYNMPVVFEIEGDLDKERLENTFKVLVNRHEALRTSFSLVEEALVQTVHDEVDFGIEYLTCVNSSDEEIQSKINSFIRAFNLNKAPLIRAGLIKLANSSEEQQQHYSEGVENGYILPKQQHLLLLDMHHIISDGTSMGILTREFAEVYEGQALSSLRIQYKDFAAWQNQLFKSEKIKNQQQYWLDNFKGEIPVLNMPTDYQRPSIQSFEGDSIAFRISKELTEKLKLISRDTGSTLYMIMLTTFKILLSKYSGQEDIIVGSPIAARPHADLHNIIGMFVNTLAMRSYPKRDKTVREFISEVKETALRAYENQDYQFEELVDKLELTRDMSRNPLFDAMLVMQNMDIGEIKLKDLKLKQYNNKNTISKFDITLTAVEEREEIQLSIEYCTKLFKRETIERLYKHLENVAEQITANPDKKLEEIELITEEEKQQILADFNNTYAEYPRDKTIHELFEEQVEKAPDKIAVVYKSEESESKALTYRELNERANQLARVLRKKGVKSETIVGISVERSVEMMIGIIAILKAGGAYLPIDPEYPQDRIKHMLQECSMKILLTTSTLKDKLDFADSIIVLDDIELYKGDYDNLQISDDKYEASSMSLAYIMYTSGSTGLPKGVMVEHRNVVRLVKSSNYIKFEEHDRILQTGAIVFDACTFEIWGALLNGLELHLTDTNTLLDASKLEKTIVDNKITILWLTSSLFNRFVQQNVDMFATLRYLLVGGDVLTPRNINLARDKHKNLNVVNGYGPTENTTFSTCFLIDKEYNESIPIGKPISNSEAYIVDSSFRLQPVGVVGELCVAGDGLSRGYINRPELTAERFAHNPFAAHKNAFEKMYRTGDLAKWLPDGNIEFLGRMDYQVKIRGYRIELGEIENNIIKFEGIEEAIVIVKQDTNNEKYLCAYFVAKEQVAAKEIRLYLSKYLSDYMIPSYFIQIDSMPLSTNGKIDKKLLPEPVNVAAIEEYEAPRNEKEEILIEIWEEILGVDGIGINSNFFELGGHSLKATGMLAKLHRRLNIEMPLKEIFKAPTIKGISEYIEKQQKSIFLDIKPVKGQEYYESSYKYDGSYIYDASSAQKRLYTLQQFEPHGTSYNIPIALEIKGMLNKEKLEEAFRSIIKRHEALRTSFKLVNDKLVQVVHKDIEFEVEYDKFETSEIGQKEIQHRINKFVRAFDLNNTPLLRVGLIELPDSQEVVENSEILPKQQHCSEDGQNVSVLPNNQHCSGVVENGYILPKQQHLLLLDMHHIISDGVSMSILTKEFAELYRGNELPTLNVQYKDFAVWQNEMLKSDRMKQQEEYWLSNFKGDIPVLSIPTDYPRPAIKTFEGDNVDFKLDKELTDKLKNIAKEAGSTLYMVILAALNILLAKHSGQEDIIIGSPIAGRPHADLESIIGMFVNTLAMRSFPNGEKTIREFLEEVKDTALSAYENQDYQFEELVSKLELARDLSRNPIFDVMFVMQNMDIKEIKLEDCVVKAHTSNSTISKFDLKLNAVEENDELQLNIEYCTKLFKNETINNICRHYENILRQMSEQLDKKIKDIDLITKEERQQLLVDFNNTDVEYPKHKTMHQLFEEQAERTPDNIALVIEDKAFGIKTLTYRELNEKSNQLARVLRRKGVKPDVKVGIMVDRSFEMIIGMMAILKAGGVYLPIDPVYPADRIEYLLNNSYANILVTQKCFADIASLNIDKVLLDDEAIFAEDNSNLRIFIDSVNLAYIIYTSGSTGRPKGVMIEHHSAVNLINWVNKEFKVGEDDALLFITSMCFDLSVYDIFGMLACGGRIVIARKEQVQDSKELRALMLKHKISFWDSVPSTMNYLVNSLEETEQDYIQKELRLVFMSGDWIPVKLPDKLKKFFPNAKPISLGGATEGTVWSIYYPIEKVEEYQTSIPYGRPLDNNYFYILDDNLNIVPRGAAGELYIGGVGVARGYMNDKEKTEAAFINDPFVSKSGAKMYKTGDLGRMMTDGNIEFLGRKDYQVKIRGYRVELGEIESQLAQITSIKDVVVVDKTDSAGYKYLCAYIVSDEEIKMQAFREYLQNKLPEYMIPTYFIQIDNIPLTANGKIDRKALPEPKENLVSEAVYEQPRNNVEEKLVEIWKEILGLDKVGINDNFFELGGHSLKATGLVSRIHKELNIEIPLRDIFALATIKGLSEYIGNSNENMYSSIQAVEKANPYEGPAYYDSSSAQKRIYTLQQFDINSTSYNMPVVFEIEGDLDKERLENTLKVLINRHEALRTSFSLVEEALVQTVHDEVDFEIEYLTCVNSNDEEIQAKISSFIRAFDLNKAPLLRAGLIKLANSSEEQQQHYSGGVENGYILPKQQHLLLLDMHHIISDGTSMGILTREFAEVYEGQALSSLRIQYKDFAAWQNQLFKSEKIKKQQQYWLDNLKGEIPVLNMPTDYQRPSIQSFEGDSIAFRINKELTEKLKQASRDTGSTLYMIMLTAFNILLSKYSGQEDIIVGSPIAARPHADLHNIIGMFVNTLAMRSYPKRDKTVREFIREVKETALRAYENQDYQFEELVDKLELTRDMSRNPLFDVMLVMQNMDIGEIKLKDLKLKQYNNKNTISKFDITLTAVEEREEIQLSIEYCTKLFKRETIESLYKHLENVAEQITANPDKKLEEIELITEEEKQQILTDFNDTYAEYPRDKTIHELFEEQVEKTPDKIAVVYKSEESESKALTYRELNKRANQLARVLRKKGVKNETIVGISVERSVEMIIGIIAILKAGGAYLPIDPEYPQDRIKHMLSDSNTKMILTQADLMKDIEEDIELININNSDIYKEDTANISNLNNKDSLLYVIYTSGSTGQPKGVMINHQTINNLVSYQNEKTNIVFDTKVLQFTTMSFDVCYQEIFSTLLNGGQLIITDIEVIRDVSRLAKFIQENEIEVIFMATSYFKYFASEKRYLDMLGNKLKHIIVAGEKLIISNELKAYLKQNKIYLHNHYGPSEAHVVSAYTIAPDAYIPSVPSIGKPISNLQLYIVDDKLNLQPVGVVGELCIAGDGLGRGYLKRAELTSEKFVQNPFKAGERMYRTGDLARWLSDGNIEFIGRIDNQVKIRGFRIELGEIENKLLNHEAVREAVVLARVDNDGSKYLCAYIVAGEQQMVEKQLIVSELREHLTKQLPSYMIPTYFVQLESMPLTVNGKINTKALPEPDGSMNTGAEYEAPRNRTEEKLVELWRDILKVEGIGINDDFFALGGHSLKMIMLVSRIHKEFNVEIPISEVFKHPVIKELALYIDNVYLDRESIYSSIMPVEEKPYYPLSSAQKRLFILNQLEGEGTSYNMPALMSVEGELNKDRLENALRRLIQRHESLRTSFEIIEGGPVQRINKEVDFEIQYVEADEAGIELIAKDFVKPFDLSTAPLMRAGLIKLPIGFKDVENGHILPKQQHCSEDVQNGYILPKQQHLLLLDIHHIISDGISMNILTREFIQLYHETEIPELRIQYKDFTAWQNKLLSEDAIKKQEEYWMKVFGGTSFQNDIPVLNMPIDYPRPIIQSFEGANVSFDIDESLTEKLRILAKETNTTMYMLLLGAYNVLLSKYTGQEDIVVGSPTAGRGHADLHGIIGMFVNTLAIRNKPKAELSFAEFLRTVKENALAAYENQDYQFEELIEKLDIERDISRNPLFDVVFALQNMETAELELEGLSFKPYEYENKISKFDITLTAVENGDKISCNFEYCTKLFKKETVQRTAEHFKNVLSSIVDNSGQKIADISILSDEEKQRIIHGFNSTKSEYPKDKTIQELFEQQVKLTPDNAAVVYKDQKLTYRELNKKANQLARVLRARGIKSESIVAIMADESIEMIVGILGILKAGGAYLPIDPEYPIDRINYMLQDSKVELVLLQSYQNNISFVNDSNDFIIYLDDKSLYCEDDSEINNENSPSSLAYVIYTSGSTGKPKGVMVEHSALINMCMWYKDYYKLTETDRATKYAGFSFDASVWEVFPILIAGGALYVVEEDIKLDIDKLNRYYEQNGITISFLPTQICELFIKRDNKSLRYLLTGGDKLNLYSDTSFKVVNNYGPTENTVVATSFLVDKEYRNIPIGKPISNTKIYILDKHNKLCPIGVAGELCISGDSLARGYLNRPELTAERFVENAAFDVSERMYRTGDLARWLPDGNIEFIGRIDHQVKIRGFRIELGEIESKLLSHNEIKEAVVAAKDSEEGTKYLCAYIVADKQQIGESELTVSELRAHLSKDLPDYMIPSYFIQLDKLPLTPNGKIDRNKLPEVEGSISTGVEYEAPRDNIEEKLAKLWQDALDVERVGINDDFFELGGHSLKATSLVAKMNKDLNIVISLKDFYTAPTIKKLTNIISFESILPKIDDEKIVLIQRGKELDKNIFFIHPASGEVSAYSTLCKGLDESYNYWGVRADVLDNYAPKNLTVEEIASEYIEKIRKIQQSGPYYLAGWCIGGVVAFEMARQLELINEETRFVGIINSLVPSKRSSSFINREASDFTIESERSFISRFIPDEAVKKLAVDKNDMNELWIAAIKYLEETKADNKKIMQKIKEVSEKMIPNYEKISLSELLYHINLIRTLIRVVYRYVPNTKVKGQVHYFYATVNKRRGLKGQNNYCYSKVKFYKIPGDHYSIIETDDVNRLIQCFNGSLTISTSD